MTVQEILKRQSNENEYQYLFRVDDLIRSGKYLNWQAVVDTVNNELYGDDYDLYKTESAYRKKCKAARDFYEAGVFSQGEEEYIRKIQEQERQLEVSRVKYRDARNDWSKQLRTQARIEDTLSHLESLITENTQYKGVPISISKDVAVSDKDLVVCLSDYHLGGESERSFLTREFTADVALCRLKKYLEEIVRIGDRHQCKEVYVVILGDMIDGRIHYTQALEGRMNIIEQIQKASEDISWFLYELSKHFNRIHVSSVAGNHSRIGKKEEVLRNERLDDMISWYAKAKLANVENIDFESSVALDATVIAIPIRGKNWLAVHGDYDDFSVSGIQKLVMFCKFMPYAVLYGHKHSTDYCEVNGVKLIRSGTFTSGGDYVLKQRMVGEPSQAVCVVGDGGIEAFYPVQLSEKGVE